MKKLLLIIALLAITSNVKASISIGIPAGFQNDSVPSYLDKERKDKKAAIAEIRNLCTLKPGSKRTSFNVLPDLAISISTTAPRKQGETVDQCYNRIKRDYESLSR